MFIGCSLLYVIMMMVFEVYEKQVDIMFELCLFYEYYFNQMELWDGLVVFIFIDGIFVGVIFDCNGLCLGCWIEMIDGFVVIGFEIGVLYFELECIKCWGWLQLGKMFLVDILQCCIVEDEEIKCELLMMYFWQEWFDVGVVWFVDFLECEYIVYLFVFIMCCQCIFGYMEEEVCILLILMGQMGVELFGVMGFDMLIVVFSKCLWLLFDYFIQQFVQVMNLLFDLICEEVVISFKFGFGLESNLLFWGFEYICMVLFDFFVIDNDEFVKIWYIDKVMLGRLSVMICGLYYFDVGFQIFVGCLDEMCVEVDQVIEDGVEFIILFDCDLNKDFVLILLLFMVFVIYYYFICCENWMKVGLIVEVGDVCEVYYVVMLIGYGVFVVNLYFVMEMVEYFVCIGYIIGILLEKVVKNLIYVFGKGVLKIMLKMGILIVLLYVGVQVFEVIGFSQEFIDVYFMCIEFKFGGIGIEEIFVENQVCYDYVYLEDVVVCVYEWFWIGGEYQWCWDGLLYLFNLEMVFKLQYLICICWYDIFCEYIRFVDEQVVELKMLCGFFQLCIGICKFVLLDEVELVLVIVKCFLIGVMSYGLIFKEVYEMLVIVMNCIGGKFNIGEGGEDFDWLVDLEWCSVIKQVVFGWFGVMSLYFIEVDDIQIKFVQGVKFGEGGQLLLMKVYFWVVWICYVMVGVGFILLLLYYDIYLIEDFKQFIFDLKCVNFEVCIYIKLVSQFGIGVVFVGVVKVFSDVILVFGYDGGMGVSLLNLFKYVGIFWELGFVEMQQMFMFNGMCDCVVVQVDGQFKIGCDVVIGVLFGVEEFGFVIVLFVVSGCIMMCVCYLDMCLVGVVIQNLVLCDWFMGKFEFVVNFMEFIVEEVCELLFEFGYCFFDEIIGCVDFIEVDVVVEYWKVEGFDLSFVLEGLVFLVGEVCCNVWLQDYEFEKYFDVQLIDIVKSVLLNVEFVVVELLIVNIECVVGIMFGYQVIFCYGVIGLLQGMIDVMLYGIVGQLFGVFLLFGIILWFEGDVNDYVGKGFFGGDIMVCFLCGLLIVLYENVIVGNVIGYGVILGMMFLFGVVGE